MNSRRKGKRKENEQTNKRTNERTNELTVRNSIQINTRMKLRTDFYWLLAAAREIAPYIVLIIVNKHGDMVYLFHCSQVPDDVGMLCRDARQADRYASYRYITRYRPAISQDPVRILVKQFSEMRACMQCGDAGGCRCNRVDEDAESKNAVVYV